MLLLATSAFAQEHRGAYRGTLRVVKFDVSPPLRDIPPVPVLRIPDDWGGLIADPPGTEGKPADGPQSRDMVVQNVTPSQEIPAPTANFDALPNLGGFAPPDPVGDIGPNHYVAMSNVYFAVYSRTGTVVFGPAANNTLWSGFGGQCETQNAGDPIVLYDQFANRWLLPQFTSTAAPGTGDYFNCVALSQTSDPMGPWYRWQINNGDALADYPKYGVGEEAYFISTRDFAGPSYLGVGAFALNRAQMIAGNPDPTVISFFVDRNPPANVGDGLLPIDIDGTTLPPTGSPHYYIGTMDDGGPYAAGQDAITVWEFVVDFVTPANSSFTLAATVPISPYDTMFPCGGGRACIPQPNTANRLDHQGYRQRPLHRAAYRNFGTHQSIVTNQSVEAAPGISGIRWWEIRNPGAAPVIHQEGTFAPGVEDGIHRWFGSIAMDSAGNIALGYSAANEVTFPSIWYSGRLFVDAPGAMPQGEGVIIDGTGSQTGGGGRWGDYTSMNVDPTDDCAFWYVNEYLPATSPAGWRLRVGAFSFDECGAPGFAIGIASAPKASICTGDEAGFDLNVGPVEGFDMPVSLSAAGHPGGSSASFAPNPVTPPGMSTLTIGNTGGVPAGDYPIEVTGMAAGADDRTASVELTVWDAVPELPVLMMPSNMATEVLLDPVFEWTGTDAEEYVIELAADHGFNDIVWSDTTRKTMATPFEPLMASTNYYWRVRALNACGQSADSAVFTFTTAALPGDCASGEVEVTVYEFDFEDGAQGWTSGFNDGPNSWTLSGANPNGGAQHWHVDDLGEPSDVFLQSPVLEIPTNLTNLTFRFQNYQHFEVPPSPDCWDGGMLEVSTNGGAGFAEVVNADLLGDPYDGPLRSDSQNPLGGRNAWCGVAEPYTDSRVDISALAGEANVRFRFRVGTDVATGAPGWDIDDVKVVGCSSDLEWGHGFEDGDG